MTLRPIALTKWRQYKDFSKSPLLCTYSAFCLLSTGQLSRFPVQSSQSLFVCFAFYACLLENNVPVILPSPTTSQRPSAGSFPSVWKHAVGMGKVVQWIKPQFGMSTSHVQVPVSVLAPLLHIQLPANASWEAADDDSHTWAPSCSLAALIFAGIWGLNQWVDGLFVSHAFAVSLCCSAFQVNEK